ncbi:MAG: hypothetical protein MUP70_12545 [Candidatus Aminicenantes bacterium]|nr:hypothetical protein [Candidatus Aminicenantes bacterium]
MRTLFTIGLIGLFFSYPAFVTAQFTPEELARRESIEQFLTRAKITQHERIGEGVTKPRLLHLELDGKEMEGCWKNPTGSDLGFRENWKYEIAAYKMDKYLKVHMVPPTVERRFRGKSGSLQLWISGLVSELRLNKEERTIPDENREHLDKMICLACAFDSLIANIDRTQQNQNYTFDWRMILIDHSRAFRYKKFYVEQLMYGKNGMRKGKLFDRLPRIFVERVRTLTEPLIRKIVGPYLNGEEIKALLGRKTLLLQEIDELILERGEDSVLY